MGPVQQRIPSTISPAALCSLAVTHSKVRVSMPQVLTALGAISNLYCLHALDQSEPVQTSFQGFASSTVAPRSAVLREIRKALPGVNAAVPESILAALTQSLNEIFSTRAYQQAILSGFGFLQKSTENPEEYHLQVQLPLAEHLSNISTRLNRSIGATGD